MNAAPCTYETNAEVVVNPTDRIAPHTRIMTLPVLKRCMIHALPRFPAHVGVPIRYWCAQFLQLPLPLAFYRRSAASLARLNSPSLLRRRCRGANCHDLRFERKLHTSKRNVQLRNPLSASKLRPLVRDPEDTMARPRPDGSVRFLLSLLACYCCCVRGRRQASFGGPAAVAVEGSAAASTTRQHRQQPPPPPHQQQGLRRGSAGMCFIPNGLAARTSTSRIRRSDGGGGGSGHRRRSNSSRSMLMNTTRSKRGVAGRPKAKNGVGKKVRRILEPASREEVGCRVEGADAVLCVCVNTCLFAASLPSVCSTTTAVVDSKWQQMTTVALGGGGGILICTM